MRHVAEGVLRRLDDEPFAVPDRIAEHVAECARCRAARTRIAADRESAAARLAAPALILDEEAAWARLQDELRNAPAPGAPGPRLNLGGPRAPRVRRVPMRAGLVVGAVGILIAGTAAAATFTTIFAPTHVAAVSVSRSDLRALSAVIGLGNVRILGGFSTPSGSSSTRFGTIRWSSSGAGQPASSLAQAGARAGFPLRAPTHLPSGVAAAQRFTVVPRMRATVTFNATAASVAGSSVTLDAGPAVAVEYPASTGRELPALDVVTMPRPTVRSTGATLSQIETFLLGQPGVPAQLAQELRLLGNPQTTLPIPIPRGLPTRSVRVNGSPAVLVADPSNAAAAVVWEDGRGVLHMVAGILDAQDVLNVAAQLG